MTPENGPREPENPMSGADVTWLTADEYDEYRTNEERGRDFVDWKPLATTSTPPTYPRQRWCPTHRRYELNPKGRLLCGAAWAEQYKIEREVDAEMMNPNLALIKLADNIGELVEEIRLGGVIAEPPTRPIPPKPPYPPNPPRPNVSGNGGKGGVALP
jgi:hypothetical protein